MPPSSAFAKASYGGQDSRRDARRHINGAPSRPWQLKTRDAYQVQTPAPPVMI